ncbi:MAG: phospholipase D-like domain-containing protein [Candidatus Woesearchaeota archaeon]
MRYKHLVLASLILIGSCSITGRTAYKSENNISIESYFCPSDNCSQIIYDNIKSAKKSAHCAFYSININDIVNALVEKYNTADIKLVTDDSNPTYLPFSITDHRKGLMHNKFCIIDSQIVITGSYNPTAGSLNDNNNIVIIKSKTVSENYELEFSEFLSDIFGGGKLTKNPVVFYSNNSKKVETYFCPEDWCSDKIIKTLSKANKSIYFMLYSFTDDSIGDLLVKKYNQGIDIKGVVEKSQSGGVYSEYSKLKKSGIDVRYDKNPKLMHNKIFIVDNEIVITGSYNPTKNGDRVNDENIVIIYDKIVAEKFLNEFERLYY